MQMRDMFAIALATNRTLIMPKLQCYCDRYWGPVYRCRVPGASKLQLPFICPMDHVFEPFHFDDRIEQFGLPFSFREYSFLENPRTALELKKSTIQLTYLQISFCINCQRSVLSIIVLTTRHFPENRKCYHLGRKQYQ